MDPNRLKAAYQRLDALDDRLSHQLRPRFRSGMVSPGIDQVNRQMQLLSEFSLELKEIIRELMLSFAKPAENPPAGPPESSRQG